MAGEIVQGRRPRRRRTGSWLLAAALTAGTLAASGASATGAERTGEERVTVAEAPPLRLPSRPKGLKAPVRVAAKVDVVPAYVPQTSCWPTEKPGTAKLRRLVLRTYGVGHSGGSTRVCQTGESEHLEGRAWDWMLDPRKASHRRAAADFLAWLTRRDGENARRLGVMYVIYDEKIWAAYRAQDGWRPSWGHEDHVHVSLTWDGARARTSFWKGRALTVSDLGPCEHFRGTYAALRSTRRLGECEVRPARAPRTSRLAKRSYGTSGNLVRAGQKALGVRQSGRFDERTWAAVRSYQKRHDLPLTGVLDTATWASLSPKDVRTDVTRGLTRTEAGSRAKAAAEGRVLKAGRALGSHVALVQTALGMPRADRNGWFGSRTRAAVKAFQKRKGLRVTGVVDDATWKALPGR